MMQRAALHILKFTVGLLVVCTLLAAGLLGYVRTQKLVLLNVKTGSMRPAIRPGDAVLIRQGQMNLAVGDIVSYHSLVNPDLTITHRIISIGLDGNRIRTKGDALQVADPPFSPDRIIGKVQHIMPDAGYGLSFMRHPLGLALAVYLPAVTLTAGEVRRLMRHYESQHYRLRAYPW